MYKSWVWLFQGHWGGQWSECVRTAPSETLLWLIHLPSFAECQTGPTWLRWGSYPAVSWPSVLNLSQLVCTVRHSVQVFVVTESHMSFHSAGVKEGHGMGAQGSIFAAEKGSMGPFAQRHAVKCVFVIGLTLHSKYQSKSHYAFDWQGRWRTLYMMFCQWITPR